MFLKFSNEWLPTDKIGGDHKKSVKFFYDIQYFF